ncbi:MAG TPA: LCP family protein [Streptosporangiaceae bacterium]|nr:LCP family protein [Streptosporangiaceae bacterium]
MSTSSVEDFFRRQARDARGPEDPKRSPGASRRRRLRRRIALAAVLSLAVVAGAVAVTGLLAVHSLTSSVHRIQGITALTAADQPLMPAATRKSRTILLTGHAILPDSRGGSGQNGSSTRPEDPSGLIALVHLNASGQAGAVVNLPPNVVVHVPGHGQMLLQNTLQVGGPDLLIRTVEHVTNVRINDYSEVDFAGLRSVVGAMGGVNVVAPFTMHSEGFTFPRGVNHLNAASVLPYVRQAGVSEIGREQLQSGLIRSILFKIAQQRMFSHLHTNFKVVHAMARALSVDSSMSNSELVSLALRLGHLRGRDGTFVTAPTDGSPLTGGTNAVHFNRPVARQLWKALRHDSVAAFARRYPFTVTPLAPA